MVKILSIFILALTFVWTRGSVSVHNPFYCFSQDPIRPQVGMFGYLSPYESTRGHHINANVSSCNPSKFWMLSRHGTRLPSIPDLTKMFEHNERLHSEVLRNYDAGKTSLCASDIELIRNWTFDPNITIEREQMLTVSGWNEFQDLAQRYQAAFPTVLTPSYSPRDYLFRHTPTQRTRGSLSAFADGLFGFNGFEQVEFEDIPGEDLLLRPYDYCPLYSDVIRIPIERNAFVEGREYEEMLSQVSSKLGFHGSNQLRADEVVTLANLCRFQQIWEMDSPSPWCAAFSVANHQVLEYFDDLYYYYRFGYGHVAYRTLFENMSCGVMQDFLQFFDSDSQSEHKARIFNSHISNIQLLLVTLGSLEDDAPLTRHNFAQQTFRLWRTSSVAPMASNLAIIQYE